MRLGLWHNIDMAFDVVVVGGGFTGLVASIALAQRGARVRLFETHLGTDPRFRGELIHPKGVRGLDQLGLARPLMAAGGVQVSGFSVCMHAAQNPVVLPYESWQGPGLGIEHRGMVTALRTLANDRGVQLTTGQRVESMLMQGHRVTGVVAGAEHRADLVVVADGRNSKLRQQLLLEPQVQLLSYTVALACDGQLPDADKGHVFLGGPGPVLAYPFAPGQVRFCIDLPLGVAKGQPAMLAFIAEHYLPRMPQAVRPLLTAAMTGPFEACANQSVIAPGCTVPGAALVGDAGGCAHPLTASGMTNAVHDVLTLAGAVAPHGPTDEALSEYQQQRSAFVHMRELFTEALYEVFRGHDAGALALQSGVERYWASSHRARRASLQILSGEEVRLSRFVSEYSQVFGRSAAMVLGRMPFAPKQESQRFTSLCRTTFARLKVAATHTTRAMWA